MYLPLSRPDITEEEIESFDRKSEANRIAVMGTLIGENPTEILRSLVSSGKLTKEELTEMIGELPDNEEESDDGSGKSN